MSRVAHISIIIKRLGAPGPGSPRTGLRPWGGDPSHLGTWATGRKSRALGDDYAGDSGNLTHINNLGAPGPGSPRTGLRPWGGDPSHLGTWVRIISRQRGCPTFAVLLFLP